MTNRESRIVHLKRRIIDAYDWVVGPAPTERDRTDRTIAEALDRIPEYLDA